MYKDVDAAVSPERYRSVEARGMEAENQDRHQSLRSVQERIKSLQLIDQGINTSIERNSGAAQRSTGGDGRDASSTLSSIPSKIIQRNVKDGLAALDELLQELFRVSNQLHEEVVVSGSQPSETKHSASAAAAYDASTKGTTATASAQEAKSKSAKKVKPFSRQHWKYQPNSPVETQADKKSPCGVILMSDADIQRWRVSTPTWQKPGRDERKSTRSTSGGKDDRERLRSSIEKQRSLEKDTGVRGDGSPTLDFDPNIIDTYFSPQQERTLRMEVMKRLKAANELLDKQQQHRHHRIIERNHHLGKDGNIGLHGRTKAGVKPVFKVRETVFPGFPSASDDATGNGTATWKKAVGQRHSSIEKPWSYGAGVSPEVFRQRSPSFISSATKERPGKGDARHDHHMQQQQQERGRTADEDMRKDMRNLSSSVAFAIQRQTAVNTPVRPGRRADQHHQHRAVDAEESAEGSENDKGLEMHFEGAAGVAVINLKLKDLLTKSEDAGDASRSGAVRRADADFLQLSPLHRSTFQEEDGFSFDERYQPTASVDPIERSRPLSQAESHEPVELAVDISEKMGPNTNESKLIAKEVAIVSDNRSTPPPGVGKVKPKRDSATTLHSSMTLAPQPSDHSSEATSADSGDQEEGDSRSPATGDAEVDVGSVIGISESIMKGARGDNAVAEQLGDTTRELDEDTEDEVDDIDPINATTASFSVDDRMNDCVDDFSEEEEEEEENAKEQEETFSHADGDQSARSNVTDQETDANGKDEGEEEDEDALLEAAAAAAPALVDDKSATLHEEDDAEEDDYGIDDADSDEMYRKLKDAVTRVKSNTRKDGEAAGLPSSGAARPADQSGQNPLQKRKSFSDYLARSPSGSNKQAGSSPQTGLFSRFTGGGGGGGSKRTGNVSKDADQRLRAALTFSLPGVHTFISEEILQRLRNGVVMGLSWAPQLHSEMDGRMGTWLVGIDAKGENVVMRVRHRDGYGAQLGDMVVERAVVVADCVRALKTGAKGGVGIGSGGGNGGGGQSGGLMPFCELDLRDSRGMKIRARFIGDSGLGCVFVIGLNVAMHVCEKLRKKKVRSKLKKPGMSYAWHPNFMIM